MNRKIKILLLGATGRTGKYVLEKALEKGIEVNCLARNIKRIESRNRLTLFEGNPTVISDLGKALTGCKAIISVLNISRNSDFPWSKLRTPETYLSDVMRKLIPLAEKSNVSRIIVCSAWGVAETRNHIPKWFRWLIDKSNIGAAYKDHERQEKILTGSSLRWTIVRPVGLTNSTMKQHITESFNNIPQPGLTISRKSLAEYLVDCLANDNLIGKKVVVSKKQ